MHSACAHPSEKPASAFCAGGLGQRPPEQILTRPGEGKSAETHPNLSGCEDQAGNSYQGDNQAVCTV